MFFSLSLSLGKSKAISSSPVPPSVETYNRPDAVSSYNRPDGISIYKRP